ncbi:retrovirus-related pol polyprotein from transposon TNT 1-94 [Tanacetum coccineum]
MVMQVQKHVMMQVNSPDDGFKPSGDDGKKVDENSRKDSEGIDQEKEDNVNITNNVNAASINKVNVVGRKTSIDLLDDLNMLALEDIVYSDDDEDVGAEADINNLDAFMPTLVDLPNGKRAIDTRWVFRNKKDERGIVIRNKARFVAQGYTQEEGIDYDEVFAPVARIEVIRLFLAYASFKDFVVYQIALKGDFLYGKIEEEIWYGSLCAISEYGASKDVEELKVMVDNAVNKRARECLKVIEKMSGEADVIKARERSCEEECKELRVKM